MIYNVSNKQKGGLLGRLFCLLLSFSSWGWAQEPRSSDVEALSNSLAFSISLEPRSHGDTEKKYCSLEQVFRASARAFLR